MEICGFSRLWLLSGWPCEFSHPILNRIYFTNATQDTGKEEEEEEEEEGEEEEGEEEEGKEEE